MSNILRRMTKHEWEAQSRRSPEARLRWLRLRAGKTMGDLARFLGCPVTEVSAIERGETVHPDTPWLVPADHPDADAPVPEQDPGNAELEVSHAVCLRPRCQHLHARHVAKVDQMMGLPYPWSPCSVPGCPCGDLVTS